MAVEILNTNQYQQQGVRGFIAGEAGVGKTPFGATAPRPLFIDIEGRMRSVNNRDIPVLRVRSWEDWKSALATVQTPEWMAVYDSLIIDSLSELMEIYLISLKATAKHNNLMKTYGEIADDGIANTRTLRDTIPMKNIFAIVKVEKVIVDNQKLYQFKFPGKQMAEELPYIFDNVFFLRKLPNEQGQLVTWVQTVNDGIHPGKDSSMTLAPFEPFDLTYIVNKIQTGEKIYV